MKGSISKKSQRANRVRGKLKSVSSHPRLTVFRSNKHVWAQIIDDQKGVTLASQTDKSLKSFKGTKMEASEKVGELLAEKALKKGVTKVYFDRGSYKYHGRIKALAEAARKKGLKF